MCLQWNIVSQAFTAASASSTSYLLVAVTSDVMKRERVVGVSHMRTLACVCIFPTNIKCWKFEHLFLKYFVIKQTKEQNEV